ncbi:RNA polymerase factor sigma-54 [Oryzifoliimicrobium ureilyticus]|uniref:RNA polymerase factor sigma-54 n=1 Tax=Oryzifoliimicrobium ureilyticus TaxID=3113724 RepID=UPI003F676F1A
MTPQLMQSIQLLQMTHFELHQFIEQEVEKNPLLEFPANDGEGGSDSGQDHQHHAAEPEAAEVQETDHLASDWYDENSSDRSAHLSDELDVNYANVFTDDGQPARADAPELLSQWKSMPGASEGGDGYDLDDFVAGRTSLRDHLNQQLPFAVTGARERFIAQHLVDQLDDAGYLHADIEIVAEQIGAPATEVEKVLLLLQTMDPPGVFARSLSECLAIQLHQKDRLDPAMQAFISNLDLIARRDFSSLKRLCGVDEEDLLDMLAEIRQLNPKPGNSFETDVLEAIVPDAVVRAAPDGGWHVELNPEALPRVIVNQSYFTSVRKNGEEHAYLSECLQNANWLTRSLDQRAKTILKVATEIVRQQDAFLMHGVDHLRPLNLKTVAEAIKMHESTVSRVTTNKYMLTPRGLFELKYFFTVSIGAVEGGDSHSAEAVRHRIRVLIMNEQPDKVLSDDDIADILKKSGVDLARRTVAKYRESMNIASSVQRRREKKAFAKAASG